MGVVLVLIHSEGGKDFKDLAVRLRKAGVEGKALRKGLTQTLTKVLKPVVADVQESVRNVTVKGKRGGGSRSRERFDAAKEMRRIAKAEAKGRRARARRGATLSTGLRARIAHGVKARVQYSGFRYGAQIAITTTNLPRSQRNLPKHLNSAKGWRHPVFGNRDVWRGQQGEPYFDRAIKPHVPRLKREVRAAVNETLRKVK